MAGNSKRRGAVSRSKKGPQVGTGGHRRRALEGRGPTPKAEDRTYHPAYRAKKQAEAAAARQDSNRSKRKATGDQEVIAGRNVIVEALRADLPISRIYIAQRYDADDRTREILLSAAERSIPIFEASKADLDSLSSGERHQGVAAEVSPYVYADPLDLSEQAHAADRVPLIVALDGVTDPRNVGAVLRSAGAFGADGVVVPARRAAGVTASAWRVSAGAAARVPVAKATNLVRALQDYKEQGLFVVGLDGDSKIVIGECELLTEPVVVVAGAEGKGLSRLVRENCDLIVSIPMSSSMESLNASVAMGISLYEVAAKRAQARIG